MPVNHNNLLDDPLVPDVQSNFSQGQVSNARANLLNPQQGARVRNLAPDYAGVLESRRGFRDFGDTTLSTATSAVAGPTGSEASKLQGLWYYDTLSSEKLVAAVSGSLYSFDGSDWSLMASATGSIAASGDVWFTQVADKLYFSDASGPISEWDDTEIEDDASAVATGLRHLVSHGFRVFGAANIDELWCSKILPDSGGDFWVDDTGDEIVDDTGERLSFGSKTGFETNATFRVGMGDGDKISALVPWSDFNLLVFKENSVYSVNTNPAIVTTSEASGTAVTGFTVRAISTRLGCVSHRSAVQVNNDCFFLSRDGVRSVARTIQDSTHGVSPALSYPVNDIIRRINWNKADVACAAFWRGKYILAIPVDGSNTNNLILVYDTNLNAWYYWDGISPVEFAVTRFGGQPQKLVCLENTGNVLELRDWFGFEASSASDYSDLTAAVVAVQPANVTAVNLSVLGIKVRTGSWFYRLSVTRGGVEMAATTAVSVFSETNQDKTVISWDAGLNPTDTVNIYAFYTPDASYVPDSNEYVLYTSVAGDELTVNDGRSNAMALADQASYSGQRPIDAPIYGARPVWQARTRAMVFNDPISPKKPNSLELEFDRSSALLDIGILVDGERLSPDVASKVNSGAGFLHLPFNLPANLGDGVVIRRRYNLDRYNPGREIQIEISEANGLTESEQQQSGYMRLREVNMTAFLETMEDET